MGLIDFKSFVKVLPHKERALSSFGRAPALQAGGGRFEPDRVHHVKQSAKADCFDND